MLLLGGLVALAFGLYARLHYAPINQTCQSVPGRLGQTFDQGIFEGCQLAGTAAAISWPLIIAGAVLLLLGLGRVFGGLGSRQPRD